MIMSTILDEITDRKRLEVEARRQQCPLEALQLRIDAQGEARGFAQALVAKAESGPAIIAEVKRGSPSLGCIRPELDAAAQVAHYEAGGAACLSVLTDEHFFFARPDDFFDVRNAVSIPMLRKDFMVDPYQVTESRAMGADCVLLIMACLTDELASTLADAAHSLGMEVLCETHNEDEIKRALDHVDFDLIGVNNRNLKTFHTSWEVTLELAEQVPDRTKLVAESGLHSPDAIRRLWSEEIRRFLIGEAFVRSDDPEATVRSFIQI